jgi:hypothetical protein
MRQVEEYLRDAIDREQKALLAANKNAALIDVPMPWWFRTASEFLASRYR